MAMGWLKSLEEREELLPAASSGALVMKTKKKGLGWQGGESLQRPCTKCFLQPRNRGRAQTWDFLRAVGKFMEVLLAIAQ